MKQLQQKLVKILLSLILLPSYSARVDFGFYQCPIDVDPLKYYRHPTDCSKFFACPDRRRPLVLQCPSPLLFSTELVKCDWRDKVDCNDSPYEMPVKEVHGNDIEENAEVQEISQEVQEEKGAAMNSNHRDYEDDSTQVQQRPVMPMNHKPQESMSQPQESMSHDDYPDPDQNQRDAEDEQPYNQEGATSEYDENTQHYQQSNDNQDYSEYKPVQEQSGEVEYEYYPKNHRMATSYEDEENDFNKIREGEKDSRDLRYLDKESDEVPNENRRRIVRESGEAPSDPDYVSLRTLDGDQAVDYDTPPVVNKVEYRHFDPIYNDDAPVHEVNEDHALDYTENESDTTIEDPVTIDDLGRDSDPNSNSTLPQPERKTNEIDFSEGLIQPIVVGNTNNTHHDDSKDSMNVPVDSTDLHNTPVNEEIDESLNTIDNNGVNDIDDQHPQPQTMKFLTPYMRHINHMPRPVQLRPVHAILSLPRPFTIQPRQPHPVTYYFPSNHRADHASMEPQRSIALTDVRRLCYEMFKNAMAQHQRESTRIVHLCMKFYSNNSYNEDDVGDFDGVEE